MSQETTSPDEIFVVDDDPTIREALTEVFSRDGFRVTSFVDGVSFLASARAHTPVCIILDVHIPGRSGLDILKELNAEDYPALIFIMSGQGDIPMAVEAIKHGALDFIEKPFRASEIVGRVREALECAEAPSIRSRRNEGTLVSLQRPRAPDPARAGRAGPDRGRPSSSKEAGRQPGISPRTIEVHRTRIMEKFGAKNAADLVRMVYDEGRRRH